MFEIDESLEQGAIIRVIGVGTFGLNVVFNMIGCIHKVDCFGVVQKGTTGPVNLPLIPFPRCLNQDLHDEALLEQLGTPDLVFVIANLDEEDGILKDICKALHNENIPVFLVVPESVASKNSINKIERKEKITLDGVIILSEFSIESPSPATVLAQNNPVILFQHAIQQITDLITKHGLMGIDYADVMVIICGGMLHLGVGISHVEGRALIAAEKAAARLKKQGIELQTISSVLVSIYGSNKMKMDDYNAINKFIHEQTNEECGIRIGIVVDDSLCDSILVSLMDVHRPSEEAVFPHWVKLHDRYYRARYPELSKPSSHVIDEEEYEVPPWLRKTL